MILNHGGENMPDKLMQKEVVQFYKENGYELINEYNGYNSKLIIKDENGYIYTIRHNDFKQGTRPTLMRKSNPYTIYNMNLWLKLNAPGYKLLSTEYKTSTNNLDFKCPKGHEFEISWNNLRSGCRCPYCCNKKVLQGYNDILTTNPWMINLGMSIEDAKTHTCGSGDKIIVACPNCGREKRIQILEMYYYKTIRCLCGDGVSYPEKFIISLLDQLGIEYEREQNFNWSNNRRYDFYFKLNDKKYIIECHGQQHFNDNTFEFKGGRTLEEEQKNDEYKKKLALSNGIDGYIILDCRKSELNWIKNNILDSELNNLFDLSNIDWLKCEEFTLSNRIKEICDYWNNKEEWETTKDLANKFKLDRHTIIKHLKNGKRLGWCEYDSEEEIKKGVRSQGKPVIILKNNICLGVFKSAGELARRSKELFNIELNHSSICRYNNEGKVHKGFTFKYITKEEYIQYLQNPDNYIKFK